MLDLHYYTVDNEGNIHDQSLKLDAFVNRPLVSEMFRIVGYHIPPNAVCSPDRSGGQYMRIHMMR